MNDATPRTAVNQAPGGGTDYPFAGENDLAGRVLDLYLSYADAACEHALPFSLTVSGTTFAVLDADAEGVASGDTADANATTWGDRTVYEWVGDAAVLRVVVRTGELADGAAVLDPRTLNRVPLRVESLAVSTDVTGGRRKAGNVALANGYNTTLTYGEPVLTDGGPFTREVRLDVSPGGGLGRSPGCEELEPLVRAVNNVRAAAGGNLVLTADECFRVFLPNRITSEYPRTAELTAANTIKISSDCAPCCTCDYYVRTYEGLRRMVGRWQQLIDDAEEARDLYQRNRERWLAQRECRLNNPLTVTALPLKACYLGVSATFCNMSRTCLRPLELRLTLDAGVGTPVPCQPCYINGSHTKGDEKYTVAQQTVGGKTVFTATFPYADPQDQSHVRFRVQLPACTEGLPVEVTASAHAASDDPDLPVVDDGSPWGSDYPTRATTTVYAALTQAPPGFCCEG